MADIETPAVLQLRAAHREETDELVLVQEETHPDGFTKDLVFERRADKTFWLVTVSIVKAEWMALFDDLEDIIPEQVVPVTRYEPA